MSLFQCLPAKTTGKPESLPMPPNLSRRDALGTQTARLKTRKIRLRRGRRGVGSAHIQLRHGGFELGFYVGVGVLGQGVLEAVDAFFSVAQGDRGWASQ